MPPSLPLLPLTTGIQTGTLLLLLALLALIAYWRYRIRRGLAPDGQGCTPALIQQRLITVRLLLDLILKLQKHRGLTSTWIAQGKPKLTAQQLGLQQEITRHCQHLLPELKHEAGQLRPVFTPNDLRLWQHHWQTLCDTLPQQNVDSSFTQHTTLIARLLEWLDHFGEARLELPCAGQLAAQPIRNLCRRLPMLAEALGQARALGSAVAASHYCSAVNRVRLNFLATRAEKLLQQALDNQGSSIARQAREAAQTMLHTLRQELTRPDHPVTLPATEYFQRSTQAIDLVFAWARQCETTLLNRLADGYQTGPES